MALFYPFWDREFGAPTGVTTSSSFAEGVPRAVTLVELGLAAIFSLLPEYLPPVLELADQVTLTLGGLPAQ